MGGGTSATLFAHPCYTMQGQEAATSKFHEIWVNARSKGGTVSLSSRNFQKKNLLILQGF